MQKFAYLDNDSELSSHHKRLFMDIEEYDKRQKDMAQSQRLAAFVGSDSMFYAWDCVSLIMSNNTTVDFVVKDNHNLMCLLHVLQHKLRCVKEELGCLCGFKFLKVKMKLSYQCRKQDIELADLFYNALYRSLLELRMLAVFKVQKIASLHVIPDAANLESQRDSGYFG